MSARVVAVAYVTPIGSNPAQIDYRLVGGHGCEAGVSVAQVEYHTEEHERPLVWAGGGLGEVGITAGARFGEGDVERARALVNGFDPRTGEQLVEPKLGIYEDAKVNVGALVRAVQAVAAEADVEVNEVLRTMEARGVFARLEKAYAARGDIATIRADEAGRVVDSAGLDPERVWGDGVFAAAYGNLFETRQVTKSVDGRDVLVEEVVPRRQVVGNLGYDVSFTLPKSYSLLLAFADAGEAREIEDVYARNMGRTFDWLEASTAYGMRGKHGGGRSAETVATSGFLGWAMTHRAARPVGEATHGDPHWHVHVTIANMAKGTDGKWSTVAAGGRDLMRHAPAVDHTLKALVRHELAARYGIEFARSERTGAWEVAAISDAALMEFSKRGQSIEAMLAELGLDAESATSAQERLAKAKTRQAKEGTDLSDEDLRASWQAQARAAGIDPDQVRDDALTPAPTTAGRGTSSSPRDGETAQLGPLERAHAEGRDLTDDERVEVITAAFLNPETGLTSGRRRFSTVDAIAAAADALPGGAASIEEIEDLTKRALTASGIVPLAGVLASVRDPRRNLAASHMQHADRYTTADVVAAEKAILGAAARARHDDDAPHVRVETVDLAVGVTEAAQGFALSEEQARIVTALTTSGKAVEYVIGPPGTGKTTLMRAARTAWEAEGLTVAGAATAAVAAQNLATESGIASRSVAQWVHAIHAEPGAVLREVDVLVVDEANLTDDRDRAVLYAEAERCGTKVVEVGDPKQLRGVGCGSSFGYAAATYGAHALTVNRRQELEDERAAIAALREGRYVDGLSIWADKGHVIITRDGEAAAVAMAAEWMRQRANAPDARTEMHGVVMLAATNERVTRLNEAAHAIRTATGELGHAHTYARRLGDQVTFAEGDYVLVRRNDRDQRHHSGDDVLNGTRAHATHISPDGAVTITWTSEDTDGHTPRTATLPAEFIAAGGLELGYAMTTHKAEGLTVGGRDGSWTHADGSTQRGTVLVDPTGADNPGLYVALSRHKATVKLYAGLDALEDQQTLYQRGMPKDDYERLQRGIDALAGTMRATETNPNDTPTLVDRGGVPAKTPAPTEPAAADRLERIKAKIAALKNQHAPANSGSGDRVRKSVATGREKARAERDQAQRDQPRRAHLTEDGPRGPRQSGPRM